MKTILINLVSEQTVPNILCIDYFKPDSILFLYTEKYKKRIDFTLDSIGMLLESKPQSHTDKSLKGYSGGTRRYNTGDNVYILPVSEESVYSDIADINSWLSENSGCYDKIICNITGGTKLMGISLLEAARHNYKAVIAYLPIEKNKLITNILNPKSDDDKPVSARLNIDQFCAAYGAEIKNRQSLAGHIKHALEYKDISKWLMGNYFLNEGVGDSPVKRLLSLFGKPKHRELRNDNHLKKNKKNTLSSKFEWPDTEPGLNKKCLPENSTKEVINAARELFSFDAFKNRFSVVESNDKITVEGKVNIDDVNFLTG